MNYIFILLKGIFARQSGGGLGGQYLPKYLTWLPEVLFAAGFSGAGYLYGGIIGAVLVTAFSYVMMQSGHGVALPWGRPIPDGPFKDEMLAGRVQKLTPVVDFLAKRLGISTARSPEDGSYGINYCRLFMAVKGFLIGLPVGGIVLAVLWPLAYEIGVRVKRHEVSEFLSGVFAGLAVVLFMSVFG